MPVPPPPPPRRIVTGLQCAACGGVIEAREGRTTVICTYCETPLAVVGERGVSRVMVLDAIDRGTASREVRHWLQSGIKKHPALAREARVDEAFLAWFPFSRLRVDLVGWILGHNKKKRKRGNKTVTEWVPVEREIEEHIDVTGAACDVAEFGVYSVDLSADEILPFDEAKLKSRGMLFRPTRSVDEVCDSLAATAMDKAKNNRHVDRVSFSWFATLRRRLTLVHYPLWVFRYRFRERTYQVLIDAEDGSLAYGKAPGNHLYRAACLVAAAAGSCFIGTTVLQHIGVLLDSEAGLGALGVIGLVLAGIFLWGYGQFRHGGVVEEGSGLAENKASADIMASINQMLDD